MLGLLSLVFVSCSGALVFVCYPVGDPALARAIPSLQTTTHHSLHSNRRHLSTSSTCHRLLRLLLWLLLLLWLWLWLAATRWGCWHAFNRLLHALLYSPLLKQAVRHNCIGKGYAEKGGGCAERGGHESVYGGEDGVGVAGKTEAHDRSHLREDTPTRQKPDARNEEDTRHEFEECLGDGRHNPHGHRQRDVQVGLHCRRHDVLMQHI
mmetsp:Transcript_47121/g.110979  ORF Transcript_47121/g.110979 Transcript_47121/m.110979 type:complete len:208 (-) Transcript_47121:311-934(-)